ncbi:unnamed protein product [Spirodela intermedia]|uniref:Uncharacterized protein n=1 Tax=Spirodela intermedia TaxID=51605 RepID=A0A7I8LCN9_SPIIN|nr:unnamed protein product [Spirodela intermedia]
MPRGKLYAFASPLTRANTAAASLVVVLLLTPLFLPALIFSLCFLAVLSSLLLLPAACVATLALFLFALLRPIPAPPPLRRWLSLASPLPSPCLDGGGSDPELIEHHWSESKGEEEEERAEAALRGLAANVDLSFWQIYIVRRGHVIFDRVRYPRLLTTTTGAA